jgi:anti-sigma factor RsiW
MKTCDFEKLVRYLDKQLDVDGKLDVLEHLDHCEICRDAVFHISRDRDANLFYYRPYNTEKVLAR